MTEGHRLAIEQLRAIQEKALGAFEIVEIAEPEDDAGWLQVDVSLDCSGKASSDGGIPLKRREWFTIWVPADFPFQLPATWVRHNRFAGRPHVQWKHQLCLYQAPATEWNVSDGMYGYLGRLEVWLDHAAAGQLNPSGEAMHPPVAYLPAGPARMVIPRVDAPPVGPSNWFGFARLEKVSDTRADITGWMTLEEVGQDSVAPAFLISEPMPFEFPKRMGDLFGEIEGRGVSVQLLISMLRIAVLLNREEDPLFVVLGTPMRGIAGSQEVKYHLVAWYIEPELVHGLRLSLNRFDPNPRIQQLGEDLERVVIEWLRLTDVGWCVVREDRPEIVVARDRDSATAWFKGKSVALWGCGALGSHIAEFLARTGVRKLVLHDNSVVTPGIIARQLYLDDDIGKPKASAVALRLRAIKPGIEIEECIGDLLSGPLASEDWTDGTDVVIETTGANAVMVKTEVARRRGTRRVPFISMAIGHRAERAMMLIAEADYSGGPLDIERKLRQECYRRPEAADYTHEFWPQKARSAVFQPEPGCSDATFVGSCADVALLAATMLNLAAQELHSPSGAAAAHLLSQPTTSGGTDSVGHKKFCWCADQILEDPSSGYEVRVNSAAKKEIVGWISTNDRTRSASVETGGLLFGERNDLLKIAWVDEVSGPPPDSSHSDAGFVCGVEGTAALATENARRSRELVRFLGMWHTHPEGLPLPSPTDLRGIEQLVQATQSPRGKSLMLIIGGGASDNYPSAGYVFSTEDFDRIREQGLIRSCSIHVSEGRHVTRNVGLALSGGGSRAIAFHLGCLRALQDRGVLSRLNVISAVSGGSVIAAMYGYSHGSFSEFEESVLNLLRRGIQRDIVQRMAHPLAAVRTAGTIALAGSAAVAANLARLALHSASAMFGVQNRELLEAAKRLQPPLRRWASATVAFEDVLRDYVFGTISLKAPRRDSFDVVLNACELRSGTAFRFGSRESGCSRYGTVAGSPIEVAHAVAASAAYPALLPALDEVITFTSRTGSSLKRRVLLTDGGVYDNLGVSCLEPGSAVEAGYNRFTPDYIICCDAGQGILQDYPIPYLWGPRMIRAFESVFRKAQNATQNRLHLLAATDKIKGFVMPYLGQIDERLPYAPANLVRRAEVFEYPTDFAAMDNRDIERIAARGEQLTRTLVAYYCPEL